MRLSSCLLALLLMPAAAMAATVSVTPVRLEIAMPRKAAAIEIENAGAEAAQFQIERFVWGQDGDSDRDLSPTDDFVVTPPIVTLQPGQRQILRVMFLKPLDPGREATYRLILQETPLNDPAPNAISTVLRLSLPVFVTPPGARSELVWTVAQRDGRQVLTAENRGNAHAYILQALAGDGRKLPPEGYLLPGERREWKLDGPLPAAATIQLRDGSESTVRLAQ